MYLSLDIVTLLLQHNVDLTIVDQHQLVKIHSKSRGERALAKAIKMNEILKVEALLNAGLQLDTPFISKLLFDNIQYIDIVTLLIERGANIHLIQYDNSLLHKVLQHFNIFLTHRNENAFIRNYSSSDETDSDNFDYTDYDDHYYH